MDKLIKTGEIAHQYHTEVVKVKQAINSNYFYLAKLLYEMTIDNLFIPLGYESMEDYIQTSEINIKRSWYYALTRVYKQFCLDYNYQEEELLPIGISKLVMLSKNKVTNKDNVDDWLATARELSKSDLIKEIQGEDELDNMENNINMQSGFYRVVRMTEEPFGDFIEIGTRHVIIGRDEAGGMIFRVK